MDFVRGSSLEIEARELEDRREIREKKDKKKEKKDKKGKKEKKEKKGKKEKREKKRKRHDSSGSEDENDRSKSSDSESEDRDVKITRVIEFTSADDPQTREDVNDSITISKISASSFFAQLQEQESNKPIVGTVHAKEKDKKTTNCIIAPAATGQWECPRCSHINERIADKCTKCSALKRLTSLSHRDKGKR